MTRARARIAVAARDGAARARWRDARARNATSQRMKPPRPRRWRGRRATGDGANARAMVLAACVMCAARIARAMSTCMVRRGDVEEAFQLDGTVEYSAARAPESRAVWYGMEASAMEASASASASEEMNVTDVGGVTLRIVAPAWSGSARAIARAVSDELLERSGAGLGASVRVVWERPWRPFTRARLGWQSIGAWSAPSAAFEFGTTRVRYGGEWSASGLTRTALTLRSETVGKNASTLALWPFARLRGKESVADFFTRVGTDLALVVLDPCKTESGCASSQSMARLRDSILHVLGYNSRNRLGVLMGADAWRVGTKLLETFDSDDITAVAFVRGNLHSIWTPLKSKDLPIEHWVESVAKELHSMVVHRGFFSQEKLEPQNATRLALIFANEGDEWLIPVASRVRRLIKESDLDAIPGVLDTSRGTWLLCQITEDCQMNDELETRVRVAILDADTDTIETVDVSEFGDELSAPRPFTRSALSIPHAPMGTSPPRIPHISRNQLDHKLAQTMALRQKRAFSVLFSSAACAFCQRFTALVNAAIDEIDGIVVDMRIFQIDCAMNDCHDAWDAEARMLVDRVERYPTLVTYRGDTASFERYSGEMNAQQILDFLLASRGIDNTT